MAKIALLHPVDGGHTSKEFKLTEDGDITTNSYQSGTYFNAEIYTVSDIESLSQLLSDPDKVKSTIIIRGLPHEDIDLAIPVRRKIYRATTEQTHFNEQPFIDQPQPWLMIDIDKFQLPTKLNVIEDTEAAIEYTVQQLPPEFHNVTYHWQLSSSAGLFSPDKLSVHLWFWSINPILTYDLRVWAKAYNGLYESKLIDQALYNPVQPHYVTDPSFFPPLNDPIQKRSGLTHKEQLAVDINLSIQAPVDSTIDSYRQNSSTPFAIQSEAHGYENILAELGDHVSGGGFYKPLLRATGSIVREKGAEWVKHNIEAVITDLKEWINDADQSNHSHAEILRYQSREFLSQLIINAIEKGFGDHTDFVHPQFPAMDMPLSQAMYSLKNDLVVSALRAASLNKLDFVRDLQTVVIKAAAGIGKTTKLSALMAKWDVWSCKFIEYYVPSHNLSNQIKVDLLAMMQSSTLKRDWDPALIQINVIRSFDYQDTEGNYYCNKHVEAKQLSEKGFGVEYYLCGNKDKHCEYYNDCLYQNQFRQFELKDEDKLATGLPSINVMAHNHLFLTKRNKLPKPSLVIIDEAFYQKGIQEYTIKPMLLRVEGINRNVDEALIIFDALMEKLPLLKTLRGNHITPDRLEMASMAFSAEQPDISPLSNYSKQVAVTASLEEPTHIDKLLNILADELRVTDRDDSYSTELVYDTRIQDHVIKIHIRKELKVSPETPVIIIDADANKRLIECFRHITYFSNLQVERYAEVHQFNLTFSLYSIQTNDNLLNQIHSFTERISRSGQTLIVTTKKIRCLLTGENSFGTLPTSGAVNNSTVIHFQNLRGLNDYKDYDNVIIIGREQPPPQAIESMAKALWWDEDTPLQLVSEHGQVNNYITELRGYRMRNESPESTITQVHPDRRVQDILEQVRESEITQAIDRLRLVRPKEIDTDEGKVTVNRQVFILTSIPVDITVDYLWNWDHLHEFLRLWQQTNGAIPLSPVHLVELLPTVNSIAGAKKSVSRLKGILRLINIIISDEDPFSCSYKVNSSSSGRPATSIISRRHTDTQKALEEVIGEPIEFFEIISGEN